MKILKDNLTITSIFICLFLFINLDKVYSQQNFNKLNGKRISKVGETLFYKKNGEKTDQIIKDEIIIRHKNRTNLKNYDFKELGLNPSYFVVKDYIEDFYIIKITVGENYLGIAKKLELSGLFDTVDFNSYIKFDDSTPLDPFYPTDQNYLNGSWSYPQNLELHKAWDITTGDPSVVIGLIDSGTDYNHQDLDETLWINPGEDIDGDGKITSYDQNGDDDDGNGKEDDFYGWNFEGDNNNIDDGDIEGGHGTRTAGIMVAETHNLEGGSYYGMAGIAGGWGEEQGASLMVLRASGSFGNGTRTQIINAIYHAANNGADIINMSLSTLTYYSDLETAVDYAVDNKDVILVGSAGNTGGPFSNDKSIGYPAKFSNTIAVGAAQFDDTRWYIDSQESNKGSSIGPELDLLAPGGTSYILSTNVGGGWGSHSGTSASAPHVSGIAALMLSINPELTWEDVRDILRSTTDKVAEMGGANFANYHGYGRVNANEAVSKALDYKNGNIIISQNTTFTDRTFVDKTITVQDGVTLTIKGTVTLDQGTYLYINGILEGPSTAKLDIKNGSDLIINDGGLNNFNGNSKAISNSCTLVTAGGTMIIGSGATATYDGGFIASNDQGVYILEENAKIIIKNTSNNSAIDNGTIFKLGKNAEIIFEDGMEIDGATFERLDSNEAWKHIKLLSNNNTFTNSTIKGAEKGLYVASSGNIVQGGSIRNNGIGIYLSFGNATLKGAIVDGPGDGAVVRGTATLYTEHSSQTPGWATRIRNNDRGIDISDFGRAIVYHTLIQQNDYGVYISGDGDLENDGSISGQGYGSYQPDAQTNYDIFNISSQYASAHFNFWGSSTDPPTSSRFYGNVGYENPLSCDPTVTQQHCDPIDEGGGGDPCDPMFPCQGEANTNTLEPVISIANTGAMSPGSSDSESDRTQKIKEIIQSIYLYLSEHPNDPRRSNYVRYIHSLLQVYDKDGSIRAWANFDARLNGWRSEYMTAVNSLGSTTVLTSSGSKNTAISPQIPANSTALSDLGQTVMMIDLSDVLREGKYQQALTLTNNYDRFITGSTYRASLLAAKAVAWEQTKQFGKALAAYEQIEKINLNPNNDEGFVPPDYSIVKEELADSMAAHNQKNVQPVAAAQNSKRKESEEIPDSFDVRAPFPNPFNPVTVIPFDVASNSRVTIEVYNMIGRRVAILADQKYEPGVYQVRFNAERLASGVYFIRTKMNSQLFNQKVTLIK